MTTTVMEPTRTIAFTLEELLEVLAKLSDTDLVRFLKPHFSEETLKGLTQLALLDLSFELLKAWEKTTTDKQEFLISAISHLCRASFEAFVRILWEEVPSSQPLLWNWHMRVFCDALTVSAEAAFINSPRTHDLICNVSPGTSKSTIWSILFPCWVWTRMPQARIITASHTDSLVTDLAAKARDTMKGHLYSTLFPEISFTETQDAKGHYRNTHGGERFTCTVGGKSPIGMHAHFVIVDDPIDPKQAMSEAHRKTAADFMTKVIPTRRIRGAQGDICVTMLVMQRLGVGDPTDVVLETASHEGAAPVHHFCLPAELTEDVQPSEMRKFYEGFNSDGGQEANGLMDPIRLNRKVLNEQRATLGEWSYAGQYLQKPRAPGGGMFKEKFFSRRVAAAPYDCKRIRYYDRASSTSDAACFTAGTLMAYDGDKFYIEDVVYGRWEPDERNAVMKATALKDRSRYGKYEPTIYVEAEGGSSGRDAWLGVVRALVGFHVKEDIVRGSKDTRAEPLSTQFSSGNIWLVDNGESQGMGRAGWDINGYIEEFINFRPSPGKKLGRWKDRVDATSGAFNLLVGLKRVYSPLRTIALFYKKDNNRRLMVCGYDDLGLLQMEDTPMLVVLLADPKPKLVIDNTDNRVQPVVASETQGVVLFVSALPAAVPGGMLAGVPEAGRGELPPVLFSPMELLPTQTMAMLELNFANIDPAECQDSWDKPLSPWDQKPEDIQYTREIAKKLWAFILKQYVSPWQVLVLVDQGGDDGKALSVAMAVADVLRIPRTTIFLPAQGETEITDDDMAPNTHIYDTTRMSRNMVVA